MKRTRIPSIVQNDWDTSMNDMCSPLDHTTLSILDENKLESKMEQELKN